MPAPDTGASGRWEAELTARGVRMTRQRRTILDIIDTRFPAKYHLNYV